MKRKKIKAFTGNLQKRAIRSNRNVKNRNVHSQLKTCIFKFSEIKEMISNIKEQVQYLTHDGTRG